jgi:hypothetical protein
VKRLLALGLAVLASPALAAVASAPANGDAASEAAPADLPPARFAVILGVNQSAEHDLTPLRFADDDAAGFSELFRALGARTYLLTRFDENTRRLHPQAVAEAQDPRTDSLARVIDQVAADVATARARRVPTILYFIYAGHGNEDGGRGYLALEDGRLFASDLESRVVDRVKADATHLIVDACYSVFLALGRGPGGETREAHGFSASSGLATRPDVGLLLSTSSARESHEWAQFQAGIFSHEVRSGLLGAADVNRDGHVSYRELAAFIDRANAPVPNDKFRPDVFFKPPAGGAPILDLRPGLGRRLELGGEKPGHYLLEDARGVRLADFHNAKGQPLTLIRLATVGPMFLRREGADEEYVVDGAADVLRLDRLTPQPAAVRPRGAAHESFRLLFAWPFSQADVDSYVVRTARPASAPAPTSLRRPAGVALLATGALAVGVGTWAVLSAVEIGNREPQSQAALYENNQDIGRRNSWARISYATAAVALGAGAYLIWWPGSSGDRAGHGLAVSLSPSAGSVGFGGAF